MKPSTSRTTLILLVIWIFAVLCALLGFYVRWGHLPAALDAMMSVTVLVPLALPKAFADLLGATEMGSTDGTVAAAALYWPAVIALLWLAY